VEPRGGHAPQRGGGGVGGAVVDEHVDGRLPRQFLHRAGEARPGPLVEGAVEPATTVEGHGYHQVLPEGAPEQGRQGHQHGDEELAHRTSPNTPRGGRPRVAYTANRCAMRKVSTSLEPLALAT